MLDLKEIWEYTYFNWSERQADIYFDILIEGCGNITSNPEADKIYKFEETEFKGRRINSHIIFYKLEQNQLVEIIRILHTQMDLKSHLTK